MDRRSLLKGFAALMASTAIVKPSLLMAAQSTHDMTYRISKADWGKTLVFDNPEGCSIIIPSNMPVGMSFNLIQGNIKSLIVNVEKGAFVTKR